MALILPDECVRASGCMWGDRNQAPKAQSALTKHTYTHARNPNPTPPHPAPHTHAHFHYTSAIHIRHSSKRMFYHFNRILKIIFDLSCFFLQNVYRPPPSLKIGNTYPEIFPNLRTWLKEIRSILARLNN